MYEIKVNLDAPVSSIMAGPVRCLKAEWDLKEAVRFLLGNNITGAPVIESSGKVAGVLSFTDIVRCTGWHLQADEFQKDLSTPSQVGNPARGQHMDKLAEIKIKDIMTQNVKIIMENEPISRALHYMLKDKIHRIFVISRASKVAGVISATDVTRWLMNKYVTS